VETDTGIERAHIPPIASVKALNEAKPTGNGNTKKKRKLHLTQGSERVGTGHFRKGLHDLKRRENLRLGKKKIKGAHVPVNGQERGKSGTWLVNKRHH